MRFTRLLAKWSRTPEEPRPVETLSGHTLEAVRVARVLAADFGRPILGSSGLDSESWVSALEEAAVRAALLHDLGKASAHFQRMLRHGPIPRQALRHELLSLWLPLHFDALSSWIFKGIGEVPRRAALYSVVGHHLQFESGVNLQPREGSGDLSLRVWTDHPDFAEALAAGGKLIGLGSDTPLLPPVELDLLEEPLTEVIDWLRREARWWRGQGFDVKRFVAISKALLIAADVASSVLPRSGLDPAGWARGVLSRNCTAEDLHRVATAKLGGSRVRDFQMKVGESGANVTLVTAGCGSGKTVAAYLWAASRAAGRKLFFCYPTTGTASQGYANYLVDEVFKDGGRLGTLIHSRSEADLADILGNRDELALRESRMDELEEAQKWAALSGWDVPVIVCTADTVLGLIQNYRSSLFRFPAIASGAFVFDEVHTYDRIMFQTLLRFLKEFPQAPVLLMTASLPSERIHVLESLLGERLTVVHGPPELESARRYDLEEGARRDRPWEEVASVLDHGGKVLWVVNTVERAMALAEEAEQRGHTTSMEIYHSRFRYADRMAHHHRVMDAFDSPAGKSVLAVTTQVCEVSLDISSDLLVSDLAPIPSLIQRLGRLNRRVSEGKHSPSKPAIFLEPSTPLPYTQADLEMARAWLTKVGGKGKSQRDLARAFDKILPAEPTELRESSAWVEGGPFSSLQNLRESGYTVPVVRAEDADEYRDGGGKVKSVGVIRSTIPMPLSPIRNQIGSLKRVASAFEVPKGMIDYSVNWGARWRK